MGVWKTERGLGSDSWADTLDGTWDSLIKDDLGRGHQITMQEVADLVEFCTRGHLKVEVVGHDDLPLASLHNKEVETIGNRGQIHCEVPVGLGVSYLG